MSTAVSPAPRRKMETHVVKSTHRTLGRMRVRSYRAKVVIGAIREVSLVKIWAIDATGRNTVLLGRYRRDRFSDGKSYTVAEQFGFESRQLVWRTDEPGAFANTFERFRARMKTRLGIDVKLVRLN